MSYWWLALSNCGTPPIVVCVSVPMAASQAGGKARRWAESTLEPAPTQAGGVEVVPDVPTGHGGRVPGRAVVVVRLGVVDQRASSGAVRNGVAVGVGAVDHLVHASGRSSGEVDRTG